jgi:gamma-glutamyl hercynylcysteine S-oxide synthase
MPAAQRHSAVRHELLERLTEARVQTDEIFQVVKPEAIYDRPIAERHRVVFYIGHLEAFDWNLLHQRAFHLPTFNAELDRLFAFGIDPVGGGLPTDQPSDWPSLREVRNYVRRVREILDEKLEVLLDSPADSSLEFPPSLLLNVAIEHRLMHAETLAYMLHQLPYDRKITRNAAPESHLQFVQHPEMIDIPAGIATLGQSRQNGVFGWDNEFERMEVGVPAFVIDRYKVNNGDYLNFLQAGGYEDRALWSDADWEWKSKNGISHPVFWKRDADSWRWRGMFEEFPLRLDCPVYVSHAEASAYARWAGKSLPSEAQWHRAAFGTPDGTENSYPWGETVPTPELGNFDFERWDPAPVSSFPAGQSALGVKGMLGNAWEWTSTIFGPFPGFEPFSFYRGYSADFFDEKHYVLKGGSPRTAACMLRRSFRNWFQPHYQYVYAGFRCVKN